MKKMFIFIVVLALAFPVLATAEVVVLKGESIAKWSYEHDHDSAKFVKDDENLDKVYFVIDVVPTVPPYYSIIGNVVVINMGKEKQGGQTFKYYERIDIPSDPALMQVVDLDGDKLGMSVALQDDQGTSSILGQCIGTIKKGIIRELKCEFSTHEYNGEYLEDFQRIKWTLARDREFAQEGLNTSAIGDNIEDYLFNKGYIKIND